MTAVLLGTPEVHSPEWHDLRAGGIGASEIAAVAGLSPYESPFHLWHVKKGNIPGPKLSNAMDWGNRLEPLVVEWFGERHGSYRLRYPAGSYAHADRSWQRCNPDALVLDGPAADLQTVSLLQVKTSRYGDDFGPSGSDQIPLHYRCQVQWEMDVFGVDHCWLAVLIGGNDPREYRIEADPEGQATLRQIAERFWTSLHEDDEPPIDASDSTYEAVRALHPDIDPDITHKLALNTWAKYRQHSEAIEQHTAELRAIKSRILAAMGNARIATHNDEPVLRRQMSSAGTPYLKEIA